MNDRLHYINSRTRESGISGQFVHKIKLPTNHDTISLISCSIPKSWYLIPNTEENFFFLGTTKISIPVGNYTVNTFVETINTLIAPSTATFSALTGKLTIVSSATSISFPANSRINQLFGFAQGSVNNFVGGQISSDSIVNFQSVNTLYICLDIVRDNSYGIANCLFALPITNAVDYSYLTFQNTSVNETSKHLTIPKSNSDAVLDVKISILDEELQPVDLNGIDMTLTFKTWEYRDFYRVQKALLDLNIARENFALVANDKNSK
jgi:hypothetical protein